MPMETPKVPAAVNSRSREREREREGSQQGKGVAPREVYRTHAWNARNEDDTAVPRCTKRFISAQNFLPVMRAY